MLYSAERGYFYWIHKLISMGLLYLGGEILVLAEIWNKGCELFRSHLAVGVLYLFRSVCKHLQTGEFQVKLP